MKRVLVLFFEILVIAFLFHYQILYSNIYILGLILFVLSIINSSIITRGRGLFAFILVIIFSLIAFAVGEVVSLALIYKPDFVLNNIYSVYAGQIISPLIYLCITLGAAVGIILKSKIHLFNKLQPDPSVVVYISESRKAGSSEEQIKQQLLSSGWDEKNITSLLKGNDKTDKKLFFTLLCLVAIMVGGSYLYVYRFSVLGVSYTQYQNPRMGYSFEYPKEARLWEDNPPSLSANKEDMTRFASTGWKNGRIYDVIVSYRKDISLENNIENLGLNSKNMTKTSIAGEDAYRTENKVFFVHGGNFYLISSLGEEYFTDTHEYKGGYDKVFEHILQSFKFTK